MGLFNKGKPADPRHRSEFRRKLSRLSQRDIHALLEGHVGQLSLSVLGMVQGSTESYDNNLWEAQRIVDEVAVILEELDSLA